MAQRALDATGYTEAHESIDFKNGAHYYNLPADFDQLPPAIIFQAIANAAVQLRTERQLDHLPVSVSIMPNQPRRLFSLRQNLTIQLFITTILEYLSDFIDPSYIQIRIEYEVLTVKCRNEFALVMLVLIMSTWVGGPFSLILPEHVPRFRYAATIPGLTEHDFAILSRFGNRNVGINASGWNMEFLGMSEAGMQVAFNTEYRSSLALEARGFMVNFDGHIVRFIPQE